MNWQESALCRQSDPEQWFPEQEGNNGHDAKRICRQCPVRLMCLREAIEHREQFGVWAGFSARKLRGITDPVQAIRQDNATAKRREQYRRSKAKARERIEQAA